MADRRSGITDSMRQCILSGLHLGSLRPGARLARTRDIAAEFGVAPRTVMSAYRLLEEEGLVELRECSGIYVAPGSSGSETTMLTQLAGWVVEVLLDGRAREIPPIGFPERVRRCRNPAPSRHLRRRQRRPVGTNLPRASARLRLRERESGAHAFD